MPELKLVSYNVYKSSQKNIIAGNLKNFAAQGVDLFCLQEVRPPKRGEFIGDIILQELGPEWRAEFYLGDAHNAPDYGLGFIWRTRALEGIKFDKVSLPTLSKLPGYEHYFERFFGDQARPVERGVLVGWFKFGDQTLRISNIHTDWHGGFPQRFRQLKHMMEYLKADASMEAEIICGDFNTLGLISNADQIQEIHKLFGPEFENLLPTFRRTTTHYQHLDHVFIRNLKKSHVTVHRLKGSDHYPIEVGIQL